MNNPRPATTLAVLAPLRVEAVALGPRSSYRLGPINVMVKRTGMGLKAAAGAGEALNKAFRTAAPGAQRPHALALCGLGGALGNGLVPGEIIVGRRFIDASGHLVAELDLAEDVVSELEGSGLKARTGTVVSTDHIVVGEERATLAGLGADVVDMESSAIVAIAWGMPLAVLRAISDSPGHELFSPAGAAGVLKALSSLRAARPALSRWAGKAHAYQAPPIPVEVG